MTDDERDLVARLRAGDEAAFADLVDRLQRPLLRLAQAFVGRGCAAEEVVQEAWLAVIEGLDRFEGRSSLRTWIATIVANRARTRRAKDQREVSLDDGEGEGDASGTVPRGRFNVLGFWADGPGALPRPDDALFAREAHALLLAEIERLPAAQRAVVTLRDVEGWTAEEACNVLGLQETNQRVLLHRARTKLRAALERAFGEERPR
jgi:RNA polymerase sigma-70 factor (ECF subfamily)